MSKVAARCSSCGGVLPPRVTADKVNSLLPGEVFVFGSNLAGRHGAGAAACAMRWGAQRGVGVGHCGDTYAIPTKPADLRQRLSLEEIGRQVDIFIRYAGSRPDLTFLVTEIGCGRAGYCPAEIAPLFARAAALYNVSLPRTFWDVLKQDSSGAAQLAAMLANLQGAHKHAVELEDGDFQMLCLALAKLQQQSPGWTYAIGQLAQKLPGGTALLAEYLRLEFLRVTLETPSP